MFDLAVARAWAFLTEETWNQGGHVALRGPFEDAEREGAVVDLNTLADPDRAAGEIGKGVGVLGQRGDTFAGLVSINLNSQTDWVDDVVAVKSGDRSPAVVVGPGARLEPR